MASIPFKARSVYSEYFLSTSSQDAMCWRNDLRSFSVFLHAIFPSIENIPDKMGSKSALTSAQMMCFFIYWYSDLLSI